MAVRGADKVKQNLRKFLAKTGRRTERVLNQVTIVAEGYAASLTPSDEGNLLRSMYRDVKQVSNGWRGRVGYTANYAAAVHAMPGTLKGQPRAHFGKTKEGVEFGGGTLTGEYWSPDAEPEFLTKAFERDGLEDIKAIIKKGMAI